MGFIFRYILCFVFLTVFVFYSKQTLIMRKHYKRLYWLVASSYYQMAVLISKQISMLLAVLSVLNNDEHRQSTA